MLISGRKSMPWDKDHTLNFIWTGTISQYEQKLSVAKAVASKAQNGEVIGFGSGSTSFLAVQELARRIREENLKITAIPTSREIELTCYTLGIPITSLNHLKPDWGFDGADEVDQNHNLIKGRGGAMFREKLVMKSSSKTYILVDETKFVEQLGSKFPIPIEIMPESMNFVTKSLYDLDAKAIDLRLAKSKDGPVITENGNYILDVRFQQITDKTETAIKTITGVFESGLFWDYPIEIISI
jgi:ribose 5-phosphate isomerase A